MEHIKNPVEYIGAQIAQAAHGAASAYHSLQHIQETIHSPAPSVRRISIRDLGEVLRKGADDFGAYRSDVLFVGVIYAVAGLVLWRLAFGLNILPMLFPLASGFALIGPFAAVGLYEMSRRREQGKEVRWSNAIDVFREPSAGALSVMGLLMIALFATWILSAYLIFRYTLGPQEPASTMAFARDVVFTSGGWKMIGIGVGVGFLFAVLAMSISVISFPLLLDRDVGLDTAIRTSVRAVKANVGPMAVWGMIVVGSLILGTIPLFLGLIVVLPVLGHATWHLYRKLVEV